MVVYELAKAEATGHNRFINLFLFQNRNVVSTRFLKVLRRSNLSLWLLVIMLV